MLMEQVIIDRQKCTGCGVCAEICPYRAIAMVDGRAEYGRMACFLCGHCRAVCPVDAVRLPEQLVQLGLVTMEEKVEAVTPGRTNGPELVALMRSRRSCRKYREQAVPLEALVDLVKIGTTAPSGTNSQGWNFVILPTRDDLLVLGGQVAGYYRKLNRLAASPLIRWLVKIAAGDSLGRYYRSYYASVADALRQWDEEGTDRLFHGATAAILVTGRRDASCPAEDALLATENILLAAHAMGFGSCLIGFAVEAMRRSPAIKEKMAIPAAEEIYSVIALGLPAVTFFRPAGRKAVIPRIHRPAEIL
jgi:nitroreductase/NAD-dependent dihydropyrimidine dehydrogenase PreA subunit